MKRVLKLKTMDDVRTMTDPYRTKIIMIFHRYKNEALTVKTIADEMGDAHGKVYYHVKKMLDMDALELVRTEKVKGFTAKYYRLTFDEIEADYDNEGEHPKRKERLSSYSQMIASYFNQFRDRFTGFVEEIGDDYPYKPGEKKSYLSGTKLYMTEENYEAFQKELLSLAEKYGEERQGEDIFKKTLFYAVFSEQPDKKS